MAAYFVGKAFGTHKLAPTISPGKTVEGGLGGMIGSVIGQFGDLAMSTIKRTVGIKDFGKILPGHGGILDRFDSFLFAVPFAVIYGNMTGCFL